MELPDYTSPADVVKQFAERGIHLSERELRRRAREIGAYRQIGKAMFFLPEDLERIAAPPEVRPGKLSNRKAKPYRAVQALDEARRKLRSRD